MGGIDTILLLQVDRRRRACAGRGDRIGEMRADMQIMGMIREWLAAGERAKAKRQREMRGINLNK